MFNIFGAFTPNRIARNNVFNAPGRLMPHPCPDTANATPPDLDYDFVTTLDRDSPYEKHGIRTDWRIGPLFIASYALEFYPISTTMRVRGGKIPAKLGETERIITDPVLQSPNPLLDAGQPRPGLNDDSPARPRTSAPSKSVDLPCNSAVAPTCAHSEGWAPWERF